MTRRGAVRLIVAMCFAPLLPTRAKAQDAALDPKLIEDASEAAMGFMRGLREQDIGAALTFAGAPFVAEDRQLLATEGDVRAYLADVAGAVEPAELPNQVLAVLDYEQSRAVTDPQALKLRDAVLGKGDLLVATGREGISRGVLLVKAGGGTVVVVGVGY